MFKQKFPIKLINCILQTTRKLSNESPSILIKNVGTKSLIILNRPNKLNLMTPTSLQELLTALKSEEDKSLVILKSAGGKAFSAGGDLKQLAVAGKSKNVEFLEDTIMLLNANIYHIHKYKNPIVALMDGYTLGGAVGICYFTKYKIATERTILGMPEIKLGFHPNSGATYFFNKIKNHLGYYMALTGNNLRGSDVVHAGFATHYCHSDKLKYLEESILESDEIDDVINEVCDTNIPECSFGAVVGKIDECFSKPTVEEIISFLEGDESTWAKKTLDTLRNYSPTALKIILRQLQIGKHMDLKNILIMESSITVNFYSYPDLYEGIMQAIEDKNYVPKWNPSTLEHVSEQIIERYFKPLNESKQIRLFN